MRVDVRTGHFIPFSKYRSAEEARIGDRDDLAGFDATNMKFVRIEAAAFGDGSAFSQARQLRQLGFEGCICIAGAILPDQIHMARGSGADTIEPSADILARQSDRSWQVAAARYRTPYRDLLKRAA